MRLLVAALAALACAHPVAAQPGAQAPRPSSAATASPMLALRGFAMVAAQEFTAVNTFEAVFGRSVGSFWGGGAQVVLRDRVYVELAVSRFRRTGQRAFLSNGRSFGLGIPLTATIIPIEVTGGYRFGVSGNRRVVPFAGVGLGSYSYRDTSGFSEPGENVDTRHLGYLAVGGVEVRAHRWIGLSVDGQYSRVPGILGTAGISKAAGENDLGGLAARFKVIVGR